LGPRALRRQRAFDHAAAVPPGRRLSLAPAATDRADPIAARRCARIEDQSQQRRGTRGSEHTAAQLQRNRVVAVLGGSTTSDIAGAEGQTWPDRLEQQLGADRWSVINHGVPGYSTVEHLVQTAFYADAFGRRPDCALYYVGWNDIRNAGTPGLDPAY